MDPLENVGPSNSGISGSAGSENLEIVRKKYTEIANRIGSPEAELDLDGVESLKDGLESLKGDVEKLKGFVSDKELGSVNRNIDNLIVFLTKKTTEIKTGSQFKMSHEDFMAKVASKTIYDRSIAPKATMSQILKGVPDDKVPVGKNFFTLLSKVIENKIEKTHDLGYLIGMFERFFDPYEVSVENITMEKSFSLSNLKLCKEDTNNFFDKHLEKNDKNDQLREKFNEMIDFMMNKMVAMNF